MKNPESITLSLKNPTFFPLSFILFLTSVLFEIQLFRDIDFALAAVPVFKTLFMQSSEGSVPEQVECSAGHWGKTLQSIMSGHG